MFGFTRQLNRKKGAFIMDDPILYIGLVVGFTALLFFSLRLGKRKLSYLFVLPGIALMIALPMFIFVVIVPDIPISKYLFYASMILWTSGFFVIIVNIFIYRKKRKQT